MFAETGEAGAPPLRLEPERAGEAALACSWTAPPRRPAAAPGAAPPPVWVFLHGLGADREGEKASRFREWAVSRGHGFLSFDFTGHGDSGGDSRGLSLSRNLSDTARAAAFVERESAGSEILLIGSSMGGIAALWYAALHPEAVAQVFAIAPAFRMAARLAASLSATERTAWARRGFLPIPIGERVLEVGWGAVPDEEDYPVERLAALLRAPALLLHGVEDAVAPVGLSRDFAAAAPTADLIEIEDGDHRLTAARDFLFEAMWEAYRRRTAGETAGNTAGETGGAAR